MATDYPTASGGLAGIPDESVTHQAVAAEIDGRFTSLDAEVDAKVDAADAAPLADAITATAGNSAVAGTADSALRSDAVIPMRFTPYTGSTAGYPTLPTGFTDWITVVASDDRIFVIPAFDTETEVEPPPSGDQFIDDWDRSDGAPGNGWTQISGTYLATIVGTQLFNAAAGSTNYAGVIRDVTGDVTDGLTGTVEVTSISTGGLTGIALYIACLTSSVSDNVMFWYNDSGVSKVMRYVSGVETTVATYAQIQPSDVIAVHIDEATDTYTPSINGTPQTPFTSASTSAWSWRGVFLQGGHYAGPFSWTDDA